MYILPYFLKTFFGEVWDQIQGLVHVRSSVPLSNIPSLTIILKNLMLVHFISVFPCMQAPCLISNLRIVVGNK